MMNYMAELEGDEGIAGVNEKHISISFEELPY